MFDIKRKMPQQETCMNMQYKTFKIVHFDEVSYILKSTDKTFDIICLAQNF